MDTTISDLHTSFYITAIQKLAIHTPHVRILSTNNCVEMICIAFKRHELFQDVICRRDYSERIVASFSNQIQSQHYGENRSVPIEVISLEHFSSVSTTDINLTAPSCQRHAVFHYFLSDDRKQDAATTTSHSKCLISFLKY